MSGVDLNQGVTVAEVVDFSNPADLADRARLFAPELTWFYREMTRPDPPDQGLDEWQIFVFQDVQVERIFIEKPCPNRAVATFGSLQVPEPNVDYLVCRISNTTPMHHDRVKRQLEV